MTRLFEVIARSPEITYLQNTVDNDRLKTNRIDVQNTYENYTRHLPIVLEINRKQTHKSL